ncbi:MAG: hypothetical protein BGN96_14495 [Bacteroidales bacterium 45-6]|nr:MAG: hypothetical protein BGN96_14495 [Bacteroidales bacterium 45-6]
MKITKTFLCIFAAIVSLVLVACGGKDEDPWTEASVNQTTTGSVKLQALESNLTTLYDTISLSKLLGDNIANNLISTDYQSNGWYIKINGLKSLANGATITLSNLKITINGSAYDLKTWTTSSGTANFETDTPQAGNSLSSFSNAYFTALTTGDKKAKLKIEFTSNVGFAYSSNVTLQLQTTSKYVYRNYTK